MQAPSDVANLPLDNKSLFVEYFRAHPDKGDAVLSAALAGAEPFMESDDDDEEDLEVADGGGSDHMTAMEQRQVTLGLVKGIRGLAKAKQSTMRY